MSFVVGRETRVLIQGITGQLGTLVVEFMQSAGYEVASGVTPGRGGSRVRGVPVLDTVGEAIKSTGANASLVLVPAAGLRDAVLEAIESRLSPIVLMVDGVPLGLSLELVRAAREAGVLLIGPNSPGIISPGQGMVGALNPLQFHSGRIGLISRSGGMMSTIAHSLASANLGTSTCIGIGGDSVIGVDMATAITFAENDPDTDAVVVFGEIGTSQEEHVADLCKAGAFKKPIVAYIAGAAAPEGIRYSHAGAQVEGGRGTAHSKREALKQAGVHVVTRYSDIAGVLRVVL